MNKMDMQNLLLPTIESWRRKASDGEAEVPWRLLPLFLDAGIAVLRPQKDGDPGLVLERGTDGWMAGPIHPSIADLVEDHLSRATTRRLTSYLEYADAFDLIDAGARLVEEDSDGADIVEIARGLVDPRMGLVFVPLLVDAMGMPIEEAHDAILNAYQEGSFELRPESGMGRLTADEKRKCLRMDDGTLLSWIRILHKG